MTRPSNPSAALWSVSCAVGTSRACQPGPQATVRGRAPPAPDPTPGDPPLPAHADVLLGQEGKLCGLGPEKWELACHCSIAWPSLTQFSSVQSLSRVRLFVTP